MQAIPPPPPPLPSVTKKAANPPRSLAPVVAQQGLPGAYFVSLLQFDGHPFKDHWSYWVCPGLDATEGVVIHATGDVRNGFQLEIKRCYNFVDTGDKPTQIIPLQWVAGKYFAEKAMLNNGVLMMDYEPVCEFEHLVFKVKAPGKSLNSAADSGKKVVQRNCQTWIIESANQLVEDGIFTEEVAYYLRAIEQ